MRRRDPSRQEVRETLREAEKLVKDSLETAKTDSLSEAIRQLYQVFPKEQWLVRAVTRYLLATVEEQSRHTWLVRGIPELGDKKAYYLVTQVGDRYECSCYNAPFGWTRRKNICTHIAAVMLYKRRRYIDEYISDENNDY
jgi:hypothetical protein